MRFLILLLSLLTPAVTYAQDPVPVLPAAVEVLVIPPNSDPETVVPVSWRTTELGAASPLCDLAASPVGTEPEAELENPTQAEFDDPYTPGRVCRVLLPANTPTGTGYRVVAVFTAPTCLDVNGLPLTDCRSVRSAVGIPPFTVAPVQVDPCLPDAAGNQPVILAVGDWQRWVPAGGNARITYSLLQSRTPVTLLVVKFNSVETDRLTGSDLRKVSGSYFYAGTQRGSFLVSVEAFDAQGCRGMDARTMTVVVQ